MAKFINVQIPLVELSSDSEGSVAPPRASVPASPPPSPPHVPRSPTAPPPLPSPRTPLAFPTVSDDESSDSPAVVPSISRHSSPPPPASAPVPRSYPPALPRPAAPYRHPYPNVSHAPNQGRSTVRPLLPHQMIHRGYPGPYPHSTFERGESSRPADYDRRIDRIAADSMDARYSCQRLRETQDSVQRRMEAFEEVMARWRTAVDTQAQAMTTRVLGVQMEYLSRTVRLERLAMGVFGLILGAAVVAFLPWFFPRI